MFKKIMGYAIYKIAKHMPATNSRIKIGGILRRIAGNLIISEMGKNVNIEKNAVFSHRIKIGDNSGLGIACRVPQGVTIGNDVMMGPQCKIYTRNHAFDRTDIPMREQHYQEIKPVTIGNDVWIGTNVIILPGVNIADGCIIGAGSVVTKDTLPYSVNAGNPCKFIKSRCAENKENI